MLYITGFWDNIWKKQPPVLGTAGMCAGVAKRHEGQGLREGGDSAG